MVQKVRGDVYEELALAIVTGRLTGQIPSIGALKQTLGASPTTIHAALKRLRDAGYLEQSAEGGRRYYAVPTRSLADSTLARYVRSAANVAINNGYSYDDARILLLDAFAADREGGPDRSTFAAAGVSNSSDDKGENRPVSATTVELDQATSVQHESGEPAGLSDVARAVQVIEEEDEDYHAERRRGPFG